MQMIKRFPLAVFLLSVVIAGVAGFAAVSAIAGSDEPKYSFDPDYDDSAPGTVGPYPEVLMGAGHKLVCEKVLADGLDEPGCEVEVAEEYSEEVMNSLDQLPPVALVTDEERDLGYVLENGEVSGPVPLDSPSEPYDFEMEKEGSR
ncbi:MAG: hypothetical protein U0R24_01235 [Solirubrobacterales bacterium]